MFYFFIKEVNNDNDNDNNQYFNKPKKQFSLAIFSSSCSSSSYGESGIEDIEENNDNKD